MSLVPSFTVVPPLPGLLTTPATVRVSPASSSKASWITSMSTVPSSRTVTARPAAVGRSFTSMTSTVSVAVASAPKGSAALTVTAWLRMLLWIGVSS